jgi:ABC-type uncharacterized transport system permease subunit
VKKGPRQPTLPLGEFAKGRDPLTRWARIIGVLAGIIAVPLLVTSLLRGSDTPLWVVVGAVILVLVALTSIVVRRRHQLKSVGFWLLIILWISLGATTSLIRAELEDRNVDSSVIIVLVVVFLGMGGLWVLAIGANPDRWHSQDYRQDRYRDLSHALVTGLVFGVISVLAQK